MGRPGAHKSQPGGRGLLELSCLTTEQLERESEAGPQNTLPGWENAVRGQQGSFAPPELTCELSALVCRSHSRRFLKAGGRGLVGHSSATLPWLDTWAVSTPHDLE